MNFKEFQLQKESVFTQFPFVVTDLTETRFAEQVSTFRPSGHTLFVPEKAHRCHLAEWWLDYFDLPLDWKPRALIGVGVRQILTTFFNQWAKDGTKVLIPNDIYPVYLSLADKAGLAYGTFATHPTLPLALPAADVLLIANPIKPRSSTLSNTELTLIKKWLQKDSRRRVVIDAVYTFGNVLDAGTLSLYQTGQAVILHSMSKGWAQPLVMGTALVPESDIEGWGPLFRDMPTDPKKLALAQSLFSQAPHFPAELAARLAQAEKRLIAFCQSRKIPLQLFSRGSTSYFIQVQLSWKELLLKHHVLGLPMTVFGGDLPHQTVISSLLFLDKTPIN